MRILPVYKLQFTDIESSSTFQQLQSVPSYFKQALSSLMHVRVFRTREKLYSEYVTYFLKAKTSLENVKKISGRSSSKKIFEDLKAFRRFRG